MATNGEIVKGLYAAFGRGDVATVLGSFDGAIEWREADNFLYADRNPYIGPAAVAEGVMQRLASDVEQFTIAPQSFTDAGPTVVVEGRYTGRMKATGKPVDAQFAHVWTLRDGKVIRFQQYTDTKQWSEAARP
jgi:ketosteroid isomerase-like protein